MTSRIDSQPKFFQKFLLPTWDTPGDMEPTSGDQTWAPQLSGGNWPNGLA